MYLALEGHLSYHGLNNNYVNVSAIRNGGNLKVGLKNNMLYGLALQIGTQLENQVTPFVSLGFTGGKYKMSISGNVLANNFADTWSKNIFGFTPCGGMILNYGELSAIVKYQYVMGGKLSRTFIDDAGGNIATVSHRIREHIGTVGLAWSF